MRKLTFSTVLLITLFINANAQYKNSIGINGGVTIPTSEFQNRVGSGFGGSLSYSYIINKRVHLSGSIGYFLWDEINLTFTTIPLMFGIKYFYGFETIFPYIMGEIGTHISKSELEITVPFFGITTFEKNSTQFGGGVGLGVMYPFNENFAIDFNAKININPTENSASNYISLMGGLLYSF